MVLADHVRSRITRPSFIYGWQFYCNIQSKPLLTGFYTNSDFKQIIAICWSSHILKNHRCYSMYILIVTEKYDAIIPEETVIRCFTE